MGHWEFGRMKTMTEMFEKRCRRWSTYANWLP